MDARPDGTIPVHLRRVPWHPLLIGALAFWLTTGGSVVRPDNVGWVMGADPAMNQLGWMFFRNAPILQQPFGANRQFGMELGSSTVYSDSISLLAFPLKLFKASLPEPFQYFGIWILLSYLLQALFAWHLLDRLTQGKIGPWRKAVATAFFVITPVFVWRTRWHFALGTHWLILAGFCLCFASGLNPVRWIILLLIASLVSPINLAMVLIIFGAALARLYFGREIGLGLIIRTLAVAFSLLLFTIWQAGYFTVSDVGSSGFGEYRTSVLGLIDPAVGDLKGNRSWSYIFPDQPQAIGNYEGFCFLGAGMILLIAITAGTMAIARRTGIEWKKLWPILLIFAFSILFAISNNIGVGPHIILHYEVPFLIERVISPFRASGRFIWLAYYLLMAGTLTFVLTKLGRIASFTCLSLCLIIQILDSSRAFVANRASYDVNDSPALLDSAFWRKAAAKYTKIIYLPPAYSENNYIQLCYYAASHRLPISLCRYGRTDERLLVATRLNAVAEIDRNGFDPRALYVFENPAIWARELTRLRPRDWAGAVDGYDVVAPGWQPGARQDIRALIQSALPKYQFGTELQLGKKANAKPALAVGWEDPEKWGVWSDGPESIILLQLAQEPVTDLTLEINGQGLINRKLRRQTINVSINGRDVGQITYSNQDTGGTRFLHVPRDAVAGHDGIVEIKFRSDNGDSPAREGVSLDPRIMALGLKSLVLR